MFRATVTGAVAPRLFDIRLAALQTSQRIGQLLVLGTRLAVEVEQVLAIGGHEPVDTSACGCTDIHGSVAHGVRAAVAGVYDGAISSAHHTLGLAVAVPIIDSDVLFVVLEVAHIGAAVDPPKTCTIELEAFEDGIFLRIYAINLGPVARIGLLHLAEVVELHDNLQLTIAINIGAGGVIGHQRTLDALMRQLYLLVGRGPHGFRRHRLVLFVATHDSLDAIGAGGRTALIREVGHGEWCLCDFLSIAIDIVCDIVVLFREYAPTQEDPS